MTDVKFGPGVREVVEMACDESKTLNLKELCVGDKLVLEFFNPKDDPMPEEDLEIEIVEQPEADDCVGVIDGKRWRPDCENDKVEIILTGSCTANPQAVLGFSMLTKGRLTVGRNMIIFRKGTSQGEIFFKKIKKMTLYREHLGEA